MYALFLLGAVLVTAQGSSIKMIELENSYRYPLAPIAIPVQVQFITQKDIQATGKVTQHYDAALCGGCSFDGLNARFAVNLVNNPWDYDAGDYITVTVLDSAGNVITTNVNESSKIPQPDFNFTYSVKFKNLYFTIVTGPAPSFVFTLSLTFDYKNRVYFPVPCKPRWQMTAMEYAVMQNYSKGDDTGHLVPVFKSSTTQDVVTGRLKLFRLDYCFGASHFYNITITVVAEDQKSGFASFACKKTYNAGKCDVRSPYFDISGGPVNFILVGLEGPMDYGPVQVLVRGDGRFGDSNNFTIAASVPFVI